MSRSLFACLALAASIVPAVASPPTRPDSVVLRPAAFRSVSALRRHIAAIEATSRKRASKQAAARSRAGKVAVDSARQRAKEGGTGLNYLRAYLFYISQRAFPNDTVDWSAWQRAIEHRQKMPAWRVGAAGGGVHTMSLGPRWEFIGPRNLPVPYRTYYGQGSTSGRVNAVAYDAGHPGTAYLAASGGGLWKTTDSGTHWSPLSDAWPLINTSCVALDPSNTDTVYAGVGDFDGNRGYSSGVMKSTDGGATWTLLGQTSFGGYSVSAIVVDPETPSTITVTTGRGRDFWGYVWRSTNGGATWTSVLSEYSAWSDLKCGAKAADGTRYYYAIGHYYGGRVYRSADRGATWTRLTPPLSAGNWYDHECLECAVSPTDPNTVYLLVGFDHKLFKSISRGDAGTWTDITGTFPNGSSNYNWSQMWYDAHLNCSTRDGGSGPVDVLYAGLITLAQSRSGDSAWQDVGMTYTSGALTHNDAHCMAFDPADANKALVGNDGGVYGFTYDPAANAWSFDTSLSRTLGITEFYRMDAHPSDPDKVIGGTQDNATPVSTGDLANWKNRGGGDGGFCAINQSKPNIQYCTSQYLGIYRTDNEWASSSGISPDTGSDRTAFIAPIAINPSAPDYLYAGTNYLWRYDDATGSWTARLGGVQLASGSGVIMAIGVSPSDANRIYTGSSGGEVWMTTTGGSAWTQINSGGTSLPARSVTSIAVDPGDPSNVFVTLSGTGTGHVWRCSNTLAGAARTWTNISGTGASALPDVPVNSIALDIDSPASTLYVATDVGVFASADTGASWSNATQPLGLPNAQANDMKAVPGTRTLYVATYGRGIWRIPLVSSRYYVTALTLSPESVRGGESSVGTVTIGEAAPAGGTAVTLMSDDPATASAPATVTVPEGETTATFAVTTQTVTSDRLARITATAGGMSRSAVIEVREDYAISGVVTSGAAGLPDVTISVTGPSKPTLVRSIAPGIAIPDDDATGITSAISVPESGALVGIKVGVDVTHTWIGDLEVALIHPNGTAVLLHDRTGSSDDNIVTSYPDITTPAESLDILVGQDIQGDWTLRVRDLAAVDTGTLNSWRLTLTYAGTGTVTTVTDATGAYLVDHLVTGTFTVTPTKAGIVFQPAARDVVLGPSQAGVDFSGGEPTSLTVPAANGTVGQPVTLSAHLTRTSDASPIIGRSVAFSIGGMAVGSGTTDGSGAATVTCAVPDSVGSGAVTIDASFAGDATYAPSSGAGTLTVAKANTSMSVLDRSGIITTVTTLRGYLYRQPGSVVVAGRTMAFSIDGTGVGSATTDATGRASLNWIIDCTPGAHTIAGQFAGDGSYNPSSANGTLTATVVTTKVYVPARSGRIKQRAVLRAFLFTLANVGIPGKSLAVRVDGTLVGSKLTDSSGRVEFYYTVPEGAGAGARVIRGEWAGSAGYTASAANGTLTVTQGDLTIWVYVRSGKRGTSHPLKAYVRSLPDYVIQPGKSILFRVNGTDIGTTTVAATGWAIVNWSIPAGEPTGAHTASAVFAGDAWYLGQTQNAAFNVVP